MKKFTKLFAMALAVMMLLSLATTAFAANITIDDGDVTGAEYGAYKLLDATDLGNGKFDYTVNATYRTALQAVVGEGATDAEILAYIAALDDAATRTFADAVYAQIKTMTPDEETKTNKFENIDEGYYLIVETATGSAEDFDEDTFSLVMLDTAGKDGTITIKTKEDLPQSEKKVKDANDTEGEVTDWQDSADHDIGDKVPFQITFTLPSDFAEYETYFVGIHDIQAEGLTYNNDLKVTVNNSNEKILTNAFTYTAVAAGACENGCTFHVQCNDIIAAAETAGFELKAGDKIVFNYTSTLNENAKLGATGNPNEMTIEFSNNPYGDGTSETPKDRVIVFTYKVNADKYKEAVGDGNELTGAGFTLYKEVPANTANAKTGAEIKEELVKKQENVKANALADDKYYVIACQVETDAAGDTFGFKGVDDGTYVLVETTIPTGYNAWDAVEFEITAEHDVLADDPKLTSLTGGDLATGEFKDTGIIDTDIINKSGIELPETGGIGTTIFYVVGGLLAVVAIVLLVTKKRMNSTK